MDDVAKAARVSRRTLFRLFPSKADLAWAGVADAMEFSKQRFAELRPGARVVNVFRDVLAPVLARFSSKQAMPLARRRLRIIASSPELFQHASLDAVQRQLAVILGRGRATPKSLLAARSVVAVGFGSMLWWAEHGGRMTPLAATREAFNSLR